MAEFYTLKPVFGGSSSRDQLLKYLDALGSDQISNWKEGKDLLDKLWMNKIAFSPSKVADLLPNASKDGLDLIMRMLGLNPENRPSADEVLKHQFFNQTKMIGSGK